jgi:hypothetical protein
MGEVQRSLDELAAGINAEHRALNTAANAMLDHALKAGALLVQAKERMPHGSWGAWLAANFEGSGRSARAYMRVWTCRAELEAVRQSSAISSLDGALKALSTLTREEPQLLERAEYLADRHPGELEAVRRGQTSVTEAYEAARSRDRYEPLARFPRKEQVKMGRRLDKLPEAKREGYVEELREGDPDTVAFLTGRPPVPKGDPPYVRAQKDPGVRFTKAIADLYEHLMSIEDGGGIVRLSRDWSDKSKEGYLAEVREIRLILSSWEEQLEMESQ